MAYLGKAPNTAIVNQTTSQSFNGDGSTVAFTLNRSVNVSEDLEVFVENVQQEPGTGKSYTASGTTLTFDEAPPSGTGNVYVIYRGEATINPRLEHDANSALAATTGTFSGNVSFPDSVKAQFGNSSDLQIYHDSGNSRIVDAGTGNLNLQADNNVNILDAAGTGFKAQFVTGGFTKLFYNGNERFVTTSSGIDVTGRIVTDAITETTGGRVCIGGTNPSQKFVVTNAGADNIVMAENSSASIQMFMQAGSSEGTVGTLTNHDVKLLQNNAERVKITSGGMNSLTIYNNTTVSGSNLFISGGYNFQRSTSSSRYKTEITDATHGLDEVMNLRPVTYKGVNDGDRVFGGLIAEEVHDAGLTEFVDYSEDEDGNERPEGIHYGHMAALAFKAIQELKTELDAEKAKVADLMTRIEALEGN